MTASGYVKSKGFNVSLRELAGMIGYSRQQLYNWWKGDRERFIFEVNRGLEGCERNVSLTGVEIETVRCLIYKDYVNMPTGGINSLKAKIEGVAL